MSLALRFFDTDEAVVTALDAAFADVPEASADVADARVLLRDAESDDGIVSPANSYGIMDGGIDAVYTAMFGRQLQEAVQKEIRERWRGEQPVGTCFAVQIPAMAGVSMPFLLHAPTMRTPQLIDGTDAVYRAMRAIIICALSGVERWDVETIGDLSRAHRFLSPINRIFCPGLGTLTGGVTPESAAAQMRLAWDTVCSPVFPLWETVRIRETKIAAAVRA